MSNYADLTDLQRYKLRQQLELNAESFRDGCFYLNKQESDMEMPTLFDTIE